VEERFAAVYFTFFKWAVPVPRQFTSLFRQKDFVDSAGLKDAGSASKSCTRQLEYRGQTHTATSYF
jgi:hypothetical protein